MTYHQSSFSAASAYQPGLAFQISKNSGNPVIADQGLPWEDLPLLFLPDDLNFQFSILDAYRIRISHTYDKLASLSNSRTRLLPHQIEATHRVVNALRPRFILADEVGLGKTIEAGLIIKELMLRKGFRRVLVCVPAPLQEQWRQEMKNKFNENFTVLNRSNFATVSSNWSRHTGIITSIDFIKNDKYADAVLRTRWDIAVFDEAHRLRRDYNKSTKAYLFAERISQRSEALLLLTATPFRGKLEELFYLVRLVDPHIFGPYNSFVQEYMLPSCRRENSQASSGISDIREKISRIMVRRRKVEVGGFTKRFACTIRFELSPEERIFYDEMTEYVKREFNLAMDSKNRAVGFVMIVFQKLLDSSTRALLRALEKRRNLLEQRLHGGSSAGMYHGQTASRVLRGNPFLNEDGTPRIETDKDLHTYDAEDTDPLMSGFLDDCETPEDEMEQISEEEVRNTIRDLRQEILTLNRLIQIGRSIKADRKLIKLKETLNRLKKEGHAKFIIFTQFRTTQEYLAENLSEFKITLFHGSLGLEEKEKAVREFRKETEIFISTEAGGEGRNLQFANALINYDLPWSPLKVEQRIGRIHRFGQEKDVFIFNFSTRDTVAERILEVLERKIQLFNESIGPSDALLGAVEDEGDFQQLIMSFISGRKSKEDFDNELNSRLQIAENGYRKLNELVTPQLVDFNLDDYYAYTKRERRIDNDEVEKLVLSYLKQTGDTSFSLEAADPDKHPWIITKRADYVLKTDGSPELKPATFRSDIALEDESIEFLAAGHPLTDRILDYYLKKTQRTQGIFLLPGHPEFDKGFYFIYLINYTRGFSRSELISAFVSRKDGSVTIPDALLFPPGYRLPESDADTTASALHKRRPVYTADYKALRNAAERAEALLTDTVRKRGEEYKEKLHPVFKKEEYKLEISYFKRIRQLEEKRDRQRMRMGTGPSSDHGAALKRTENEIIQVKQELERELEKIRRESVIRSELKLLQTFIFV